MTEPTITAIYCGGLAAVQVVLGPRTLDFLAGEPVEVTEAEAERLAAHPHFTITTLADEADTPKEKP